MTYFQNKHDKFHLFLSPQNSWLRVTVPKDIYIGLDFNWAVIKKVTPQI